MIVESLKKLKRGNYSVVIDGTPYTFDEDIIVQFRLVKGKEIEPDILDQATKKNSVMDFYHKGFDYCIKYGKTRAQMIDYFLEKGLTIELTMPLIERLEYNKIINDRELIDAYFDGLIKKKYGRLLIKRKLFERKFPEDLIEEKLNNIDYSIYYANMRALYEDALKRGKDKEELRALKAKKHLILKGYTYDDLSNI